MEAAPIEVFVCRCGELAWEAASPLLAPERRERCAHLPADAARRSAAAGLLLRHACRTLLGADPGGEARDEAGRPYLPAHPGFFFSLSHSGDLALCAAGFSPVGADVQQIRPVSGSLLWRFFSEAERSLCHDDEAVIRLWCARESYGKLSGRGLSQHDLVEARSGTLWIGNHRITELLIADDYRAAVCSGAPVKGAPVFLTTAELLEP